jgi:hypothetical protein
MKTEVQTGGKLGMALWISLLSNLHFIHKSSPMKINDKVISFVLVNPCICLKFPWLFNGNLYMYKCYGGFGLRVKLVNQCVTR